MRNLERQIDIKYTVSGIQELETAGQVLQGTADLVQRLKSEGVIKLKAEVEMQSNAATSRSTNALINGAGTREEIDKAAIETLGISQALYYSNRARYLAQAQEIARQNQAQENASLVEELNNMNPTRRQQRINELRSDGYRIIENEGQVSAVTSNGANNVIRDNPFDTMQLARSASDLSSMMR